MRKAGALLLCLPILAQAVESQPKGDSAHVVTLSERVGPTISVADARRYHIFSSVEGFLFARVVQLRDSSYGVVFRLGSASGADCGGARGF
ncbi:MAG TPA: hypothetical protein VEO56_02350 [Bacteroidota bacterium]|nr:hypothetical protein [Bacteroidota bacterium]